MVWIAATSATSSSTISARRRLARRCATVPGPVSRASTVVAVGVPLTTVGTWCRRGGARLSSATASTLPEGLVGGVSHSGWGVQGEGMELAGGLLGDKVGGDLVDGQSSLDSQDGGKRCIGVRQRPIEVSNHVFFRLFEADVC